MRACWTACASARCSIWCLSTNPIASPSAATTTRPMAVNRPSRDSESSTTTYPGHRRTALTLKEMPEGDTIHYAASRIRPVLEGHVPDEIATPHPRFGRDRWPERLGGRVVRSVDAYGKHLFVRFEGDLVIHSHLRMTGSWRVRPVRPGAVPRVARPAPRRAGRGPAPRPGAGADDRVAHPLRPAAGRPRARHPGRRARRGRVPAPAAPRGPDAADRRRAARPAHDRRHRQPVEERGLLRGRHRPVAARRRGERRRGAGDRARDAARGCGESAADGRQDRWRRIYNRRGPAVPALRQRRPSSSRGMGDDNRPTFWCPSCQR